MPTREATINNNQDTAQMLTKLSSKFMLGAATLVVGVLTSPLVHAMPPGTICLECRRVLWNWLCYATC